MSIAIKHDATPFTPSSLLNDFVCKVKNKVINLKDKMIIVSTVKIFEIIYDESLRYVKLLLKAKNEYTLKDMKNIDFDSIYNQLEKEEEKLWEVYKLLKEDNNDNNIYELQLIEILDNTLNNYAKMNNILGYFESQIIQNEIKSA